MLFATDLALIYATDLALIYAGTNSFGYERAQNAGRTQMPWEVYDPVTRSSKMT